MSRWTPKTTRKWFVVNMKGDTVHEVEASYATIEASGALVFQKIPEPTAASEVTRAFAPGYWSQMQMLETPEPAATPEKEGTER